MSQTLWHNFLYSRCHFLWWDVKLYSLHAVRS